MSEYFQCDEEKRQIFQTVNANNLKRDLNKKNEKLKYEKRKQGEKKKIIDVRSTDIYIHIHMVRGCSEGGCR